MVEATTAPPEQAREKLVQIAREVQRLSESPLPVPDFFRQFVRLITAAVGAPGAVVWLRSPDGRIGMAAEQGTADSDLAEVVAGSTNQALVQETFSTGQARCVSPGKPNADAAAAGLIILAPLHRGEDCAGVVEVFQRPNTSEQARKGFLQFIEQMSAYASRFLTSRQRQQASPSADRFWQELSELSFQLQTTRRPEEVASVAANDGRLLLKCDRVSVLCKRGRKLRVEAVSGMESVNHRANLVGAMSRLATRVLPMKQTFDFAGNADEMPSELRKPLADFIAESGCRSLLIVPLFEPEPLIKRKDHNAEQETADGVRDRKTPFGCLVVEQFSEGAESTPRKVLAERSEAIAEHAAAALSNARAFHRIFLRSVFGTIGDLREFLYGRRLLKTLGIAAILASVVVAMIVVKWEYRVEATGQLMPAERQAVFAHRDGEIAVVHVKGGQRVTKGELLITIRNDEILLDLAHVRSNLAEKQEEKRKLEAQIDTDDGRLSRDERNALQGQLAQIREAMLGLKRNQAILEERKAQLELTAPIDGVVATFRVEEMLDRRPVQRGEVLLEVMRDDGPWRLELDVEEHRMGHLLRAQQAAADDRLPLEFVLATSPADTYSGALQHVSTRPKRLPEKGSLVEILGSIQDDQTLERRIGAEVRAKIDCGERALGYVLFGDAIEFVRSRLWL